jgi:hypothetical protein
MLDFPEDKLEYFEALLRTHKGKNLRERIDCLRGVDPEVFDRTLGFAELVYRNHWVVIPIEGEGFAFSVGMNYEYGAPEVMIISNDLSHREFQRLINELNCLARDKGPLELGKDYFQEVVMQHELDLSEKDGRIEAKDGAPFKLVPIDPPLVFAKYTQELEERFPCGYLRSFNMAFADRLDVEVIVADVRLPTF